MPDEIILEVCKYLPLNDLHSVAISATPGLARVAEDRSLRRNVHVDLWKGGEVFSHAVRLPNRNNIISFTLKGQQDPSSAKTELTTLMLEQLNKMRCLKHLRIQGAELKGSVICYLAKSVETLELIDCSSSRGINLTGRKKRGLRTICIND